MKGERLFRFAALAVFLTCLAYVLWMLAARISEPLMSVLLIG